MDTARSTLNSMIPAFGTVDAAREFIEEPVAQRIREEACTKAYALMAEAHRAVIFSIMWQNGLLMLSMIPVYFLHVPWPFYLAYAGVVAYTLYSTIKGATSSGGCAARAASPRRWRSRSARPSRRSSPSGSFLSARRSNGWART